MSKSLADLRQPRPASRPERSLTVCLNPALVAEMQALTDELANLPAPTKTDGEGERNGPPKRVGEGEHPRAAEIRARIGELLDEMGEWEGELRVRAVEDGEWRRWANDHPARAEGEPGHERDQEVAGGYCNADDLLDDLARYAHSWNGELLAEGDWVAHFVPNIAPGDLKQAATAVVSMHESRLDFRQWRSVLSADLKRLNDSASPARSRPAPEGSTDGSPAPSNAATTATETPAA